MPFLRAGLAVALALAAAPALAQKPTAGGGAVGAGVLARIAPATVTALLDARSLAYEIGRDSYGDPEIQVATGKSLPASQLTVIFYDCDDADNCESITLFSRFAVSGGADVGVVNAYNRDNRWVRVYANDGGDGILEMDVSAIGGIANDHLAAMLDTYLEHVSAFGGALRAPG